MPLFLTVRFFNGYYHGTEWPPSPARLFQALIAGVKTGAAIQSWHSRHENALIWLESLGAPDILARRVSEGQSYTIYVPNNSLDRRGLSTHTSKQIVPKILKHHTPGQADVIYRWQVFDTSSARAHIEELDEVAGHLRALGWAIDFAGCTATLDEDPLLPDDLEFMKPSTRGSLSLQIPVDGSLANISQSYQAFTKRISKQGINSYTRPIHFGQVRYEQANTLRPRRFIAFEMQTLEGNQFAARWDQTSTVASWVRHAAGQALGEEDLDQAWIDSYVLGHTSATNLGHRLSFIPIASVGHQHSDGGIRRVLIVEPQKMDADTEALDLLKAKLAGWVLTDQNGQNRAVLVPITDDRKVLPFYNAEAAIWRSVTPVILHGYNTVRRQISLDKTNRLLTQAFEAVGISETMIEGVRFQTAPYWAGSQACFSIPVPQHLSKWPRLHVSVKFKGPFRGPLSVGIGRHYGIGTFAGVI